MLFLAGAGTTAGEHFIEILQEQGGQLLLAGALVTIFSVLAGILVMDRIYHMNMLATMGALCACMTNPPGVRCSECANRNGSTSHILCQFISCSPYLQDFGGTGIG